MSIKQLLFSTFADRVVSMVIGALWVIFGASLILVRDDFLDAASSHPAGTFAALALVLAVSFLAGWFLRKAFESKMSDDARAECSMGRTISKLGPISYSIVKEAYARGFADCDTEERFYAVPALVKSGILEGDVATGRIAETGHATLTVIAQRAIESDEALSGKLAG